LNKSQIILLHLAQKLIPAGKKQGKNNKHTNTKDQAIVLVLKQPQRIAFSRLQQFYVNQKIEPDIEN